MIGEKKQQQPDQFTFAQNASAQMSVLLANDEHQIASLTRRELESNKLLDKSIDNDLPDDFNELILEVPKVNNEFLQLTKRVKVNKKIQHDASDDASEDTDWF